MESPTVESPAPGPAIARQPSGEATLTEAARVSVSSLGSDLSTPDRSGAWEDNAPFCSLCNARLGKRHLNPRHHCRVCGRCVCAACSPNAVQLQGSTTAKRTCKECVGKLEQTPDMADRVADLGRRLRSFSDMSTDMGSRSPRSPSPSRPGNFDEAISMCESALGPLQQERERHLATQRHVEQLQGELRSARDGCVRLVQRIHALQRSKPQADLLHCASLDEVIGMCEVALVPLEEKRLGRDFERRAASGTDIEAGSRRQEQSAPLCSTEAAIIRLPSAQRSSICRAQCRRQRCCNRKRVLVGVSIAAVVAAVLALAFRLAVPAIAQNFLNGATLTLVGATMENPTPTSLRMRASAVIDNGGPIGAHIRGFRADVSAGGKTFGWCMFPDISTAAGGPTQVELDTELHVTDNTAFTAATARVLQGLPSDWQLSGSPNVHAMGLGMQLRLSQRLHLPETVLEEVRSTNIDIVDSNASQVAVSADTTFFSSSILELRNISQAIFALHPAHANGSIDSSVQMGYVTIPSFEVFRGFNTLKNVSIVMQKTLSSEQHLAKFLGDWMSGIDQSVMLRGPVESASPFLNNLTTQSVLIPGLSTGGLIKSAYVSNAHTLRGHVPETGKECPLQDGVNCLKGAVVVGGNPVNQHIRLKDMSFDVDMPENLAYDTVLHALHVLPVRIRCNKSTQLARMYSTPGMWAYLNASRAGEDFAPLPPGSPEKAALGSFFLAARPQPGQSDGRFCLNQRMDPMDCCFTTLVPAAACYYRQKAMSFIPASVRGNMTLEIGRFSISSQLSQSSFPINFAENVPQFQVGPLTMSCSDFNFH